MHHTLQHFIVGMNTIPPRRPQFSTRLLREQSSLAILLVIQNICIYFMLLESGHGDDIISTTLSYRKSPLLHNLTSIMLSNKRTRCDSHKKKKSTAMAVKNENYNQINQIQKKRKSSFKQSDEPPVATTAEIGNVATDVSPDNLPSKNKTKAFYYVGKEKVNISFRVGVKNYSNMLPQMSKEIYSNFSYQYKLRRGTIRSTRNSSASDDTEPNRDSTLVSLSNYSRCYVEDFMTCVIGEEVLVLILTRYLDDQFSIWYELMSSNIEYTEVGFTKQAY